MNIIEGARTMYEATREPHNDCSWEELEPEDQALVVKAFIVASNYTIRHTQNERAERVVGEAVAWQRDSGKCLFCGFNDSKGVNHDDCALVDQGYIHSAGYLEPEGRRVAALASRPATNARRS